MAPQPALMQREAPRRRGRCGVLALLGTCVPAVAYHSFFGGEAFTAGPASRRRVALLGPLVGVATAGGMLPVEPARALDDATKKKVAKAVSILTDLKLGEECWDKDETKCWGPIQTALGTKGKPKTAVTEVIKGDALAGIATAKSIEAAFDDLDYNGGVWQAGVQMGDLDQAGVRARMSLNSMIDQLEELQ
eukprot:TRINITY_DN23587_c0_g1_i1.p1 TRINITY_DN23587_c0_g1~~TRINITY_DN23587_c0_g1_i1.p1  ORF type:complete len:191 (-),score=39.25 TRINITY_DN23587_c0_g1_i1:488-1060(-)